jgi:hypothetical protein
MSTNAYKELFLIRRRIRRALLLGAKQFLYIPSIFIVEFDEIRYESSARIADHLCV